MADPASDAKASLLVFSDDWGRHPSSCQHLISQLLDTYPVTWVNTIGTRRPSLNLETLRRAAEKLRQWLRPLPMALGHGPANPRVCNPRMWPSFRSRFDRWLNRRLLLRSLGPLVAAELRPMTALTTIPLVADLLGRLPVARWVYYCVDDFSQWPGLDQKTLARMEEALLDRVDVVLAVSETLQEKLAQRGRQAHLLTHGVDSDFWQVKGCVQPVPSLQGLQRPLLAFWGLVDRRLDLEFVRRLAHDLTEGTIVLVGPESDPDPQLSTLPRVTRVPRVEFELLPPIAQEAAVLIMPYVDQPVTHAMQPLKLKEYLATGKPAVVRDLPATRVWGDCLDLADTPEAFSRAVRERLVTGTPPTQAAARRRLKDETWACKAVQFRHWALGEQAE